MRTGLQAKVPRDPKVREIVSLTAAGPAEAVEDKTLTIVYGTDFINTNFLNFCSKEKDVAKVGRRKRRKKKNMSSRYF